MIPEHFRKSAEHRALWATMDYLADLDPTGPVVKGAHDREVVKRAVDRRRTLLEHRFADKFRDYFREERAHVVHAVHASEGREVDKWVGMAVDSLKEDLGDVYGLAWRSAARSWGVWSERLVRRSTDKVAKAVYDFGAPIDSWLRRNAGKKITGITEASRKKIAAEIARGTAAGETLAQIARRIDRFYLEDIIPDRSMVIARTEVSSATNWAQDYVARKTKDDYDVPMEKEWMSLSDDRVRETHREADGQRQPLDEPFEVGGDQLMYPGDPSGSPEEIIECRCSVLHHVVEDQPRHKRAVPTVEEFAEQVAGVESGDVATALAFARGVFGASDNWVSSRKRLMKVVHHLRRSEVVHVEMAEWDEELHPRGEGGRFVESGRAAPVEPKLPSYDRENARRADAARKWPNGAVLRYKGGSRTAINEGEHVTVRGVYGMNDSTGAIYYNVEAAGGRRFTLASDTLREPEPGEVSAAPRPRVFPKPRVPKPEAPEQAPRPEVRGPHPGSGLSLTQLRAQYSGKTVRQIQETFDAKWPGTRLHVEHGLRPEGVADVAAAADKLFAEYPKVRERSIGQVEIKTFTGGESTWWGYAQRSGRTIAIASRTVNDPEEFRSQLITSEATGFHPPGTGSMFAVFAHEFGHHVDYGAMAQFGSESGKWSEFKAQNSEKLRRVSKYALRSFLSQGPGTAYGRYFGKDSVYLEGVAESFSQYATKALAPELFGQHKLKPGAEAVGKWLSDNYAGGKT